MDYAIKLLSPAMGESDSARVEEKCYFHPRPLSEIEL